MAETLASYANVAPFYIFTLLVLTGFNIPISEDLTIIGAALFSYIAAPGMLIYFFVLAFLGAFVADIINYSLARLLGPRIYRIAWFRKAINPQRYGTMQKYFQKYGVWTILLGRFIPFGMRNAIFMSAGFSHMPFWRFAISDGAAALVTTTLLFGLAWIFRENYAGLLAFLQDFKITIIFLTLTTLALLILSYYIRRRSMSKSRKS